MATVLLVAPSTPEERARAVAARLAGLRLRRGRHGGDGERAELASSARGVAAMVKRVSDRPVCIGIGVSSPDQAVEACRDADGVVVGSAVVRRLLDGAGPEGVGRFVADIRAALDAPAPASG